MVKKKALVFLAIMVLGLFAATAAYGEKGVAWLQEKNILPAPVETSKEAVFTADSINENAVEAACQKPDLTPDPEDKEEAYTAPEVTGKVTDGKVQLIWEPIKDGRLKGYKVVVSQENSNPAYPGDGYLSYITDPSRTSFVVDNSEPYKDGDFGKYLIPGKNYYFSVTALYKEITVAGNALKLKFPEQKTEVKPEPKPAPKPEPKPEPTKPKPDPKPEEPVKDSFKAWVDGTVIKLSWAKGGGDHLKGYKVVVSEKNSSPKYHEDGWLYWITDINKTSAVIDNKTAYNGGDICGFLEPGKTYYFSVTYVYKDRKEAANAVKLKTPADMQYQKPPEYVKPIITEILDEGNAVNYNIVVRWSWDGADDGYFKGFKAEVTDHESGKKSYHHLGKGVREFTLYCSCHNKEPKVEPYKEYTVRIIATYHDRHEYSEATRKMRTFGNTS